jgi:polyphenol oxidase
LLVAGVLRSKLLLSSSFAHGFNERRGGASTAGPYASFNLGRAVGDDPALVAENHQRFAGAVGYPPGALFEVSQVHGAAVVEVEPAATPGEVRAREADAVVAPPGGLAIGVRVADCAPLLIADLDSGAAAAIHAGWRGTVAGVVEAGVATLLRVGSGRPGALRAAIFPHIRSCCFEVGDDVAALLGAASPVDGVVDRGREKPHVDLAAILIGKLALLGVPAEHVEAVPGCTRCDAERFFSYRRGGARSGRHLAAIVSR